MQEKGGTLIMSNTISINEPFNIGNVRIKNRYVMAPMAIGSYISPEGVFTPAGIDYFVRRAQGGFGLIYTGAMACRFRPADSSTLRGTI